MSTQANLFSPFGLETAPEGSRPLLQRVQRSFKFIPNLYASFANSPVLLEGYLGLEGVFEKASLSAVERQIVLLAASVENSCKYCTAAHSTVLKAFLHAPAEVVFAVRSNQPLSDPKLNALVTLTKEIVSERGHVRAQTIENFLAAGYRKEQVLEVLIGIALKTMSNYLDHLSPNELDQPFRSEG
ncbi:MAG TPA: carboxymuconolactone decarboxylase family protein [Pyrinomonadaceae bacterium]|nr:carboxymuconolactone decarboxylase family protein [Pyrinomonadaceae bacterium]